MSNYRRYRVRSGCYFFTVVTHRRRPVFDEQEHIAVLREAFRVVKRARPFGIEAIVVLPDHLHCIWTLPADDDDFSSRWREIKKYVTRRVSVNTREPLWQPRFWEHWIRDDEDYRRHFEYVHFNPVKHGLVERVRDWPYSSFHRYVRLGVCSPDWGEACQVEDLDLE